MFPHATCFCIRRFQKREPDDDHWTIKESVAAVRIDLLQPSKVSEILGSWKKLRKQQVSYF